MYVYTYDVRKRVACVLYAMYAQQNFVIIDPCRRR